MNYYQGVKELKKSAKVLALILSFMLIFSVASVSLTAYAAVSGDAVGQYDYKIESTYKTVDWDNWKAYKAATHVHSVRSDGNIELNDMIEKYYELGFDALAMTDHGTVNYSWTKDQDRLAIFGYQYFVHGQVDELTEARYTEITTGTGVPQGAIAPRGYGMTEIPLGIELNGMSASKCHINGFFVDAGHGELGTSETWPRNAVKTNYDAGGITHINHIGEWSDAKSDISIYSAQFISDLASIYQDYSPNRVGYVGPVKGCIGQELVNTADSRTKYDRFLYDEILKILAPQGINVFGFCEDDAHDYSDCDRNAQYFLMPENDTKANNIKTSMTTGAFYASSKNSKGVYELGDGFSASGAYPSISNIETDDKTSQIRVTVKDADKARMVADGAIIETYDISTSENTVVFDLNNYENNINSYVRIYFTGPGGITYLQPFLLTKTETEISSVKFNVPSSDTTVKVYNAAGSLIPAANTDRVYVLDPGDYTYIASRPGYLTTEPIPFTVTQSDIDNAVKREIDVTLEKDSETVFTYFYVPETIYLNPSDMKTFDSYVDRANEEDGALNSSISNTGNVFFSRDGATDIKLSYEVVDGGVLSSMTVSNVSSASSTLSAKITAGALSSALTSDSHALIKWTATYKFNSKTFTSYSYTYIYAPLSGASSAAAAGGFAETSKAFPSWLHTTMNITAAVWLTGVHSVSGGSAAYKYAPYGGPAVVDTSGITSITATGVGMGTASDSSNGGSKTVYPTGGTGNLTIDTSRYNNFNQIPQLSVGLDVNSAVECNEASVSYVNFGDTQLFTLNAKLSDATNSYSGKRIFASDNKDPSKDIDVPISTSQSSITITGQASGVKSSRTDAVVGTVTLNLLYVDKSELRQQYENAIKFAYQSDWFADSADYDSYIDSIKNAAVVLGNPASSAAETVAAKNSLSATLSAVELKSGVSTINYLDSQGNLIESEQAEYTLGGTVVASAKDIVGYEYSNKWECITGDEEVNSGEETFGSLMAVYDAYTWNFYYDALSYTVSFNSSDKTYSPVGGSGTTATYNADFVLPSNTPSENGFSFSGWYFDLDSKLYSAGEQIKWTYAQNGTFTARWQANSYTATYDTDGGSKITQSTQSVLYGDTFDITEEIPTKAGFAFAGWHAVMADGQDLGTVTSGGRFTWNYASDITFTAIWKVVNLTVTLETSGGTVSTDKVTVTYGSTYGELPVPVKTGFVFGGWYFDENCTSPATASTTVTKTADHTLYAKWSKGKYNVNYYVDGELYLADPHEFGDTIAAIATPSKAGYSFSGWSEIPSTMPANDVNVYGTFTANKYNINYFVDGVAYKSVSVAYAQKITPEAAPVKTGYTFSGWTGLPDTMPANDITVNGYFSADEYTVTYYVDGKVYTTQKYNYGDTINPYAEPTKAGYTFSGWSEIPSTMPAKNISVYGTFSAESYTVSYYVDGKLYNTQQYAYGDTITPLASPEKVGYTFSGWTAIPETMPARDLTVNGKFTVNQYSYLFVVNGEMRPDLTIRANYGDKITAPVPECAENYQFSGWSPAVPETMGAEAKVFTGTITKVTSDITFDINGASGITPRAEKYKVGETVTLPDSTGFTKSGYTFGGWSQDQTAVTGAKTLTVTEDDITLYAVWNMVTVGIEPAEGSDTVVDNDSELIYGVREKLTQSDFESDYVSLIGENASVEYTQGLGFGTGTLVELKDSSSDTVVKTYSLVVYGDLDGDGVSDGQDVMLAKLLADGILTKADVSAAVFEAADCNHDSQITDDDVELIISSGVLAYTITQVK